MTPLSWQHTPFTIPLLLTGLFCGWTAYVSWRRRSIPGAVPFVVLMSGITGWVLVSLVEKSLTDYAARRAASSLVYVFIVLTPAAWLTFTIRFARQDRWFPPRLVPLLFLEPILVLILVFTDAYHGLFRAATVMDRQGPYAVMVVTYGPLFWVHTVYSYCLFGAGAVFAVLGVVRRPNWTLGRLAVLVGGMAVPLLGNVGYVLRWQPEQYTDLTPVYFAVSALAAGWLLFQVRVFDVLPVARDFVVDCLNDAVLVLDNQGRLIDGNPAGLSLFPDRARRWRNQPLAEVLPGLHLLLASQAPPPATPIEILLRRDCEERWWDLHVLPMVDHDVTIGTLLRLTDITDRKNADAERRAFEDQLRHTQKLESLGVLAGGIAHDFNNLLTVILGNIELARAEAQAAPDAISFLTNAARAVDLATALTQQMLTYSGKTQFVTGPVAFNALIQDMNELLRSAVAKQAVLEFDLAPSLPPILGDAGQFRQLLLNLVINASEALGGQAGTICVRTRSADVTARDLAAAVVQGALAPGIHFLLEVADTGAGMDRETVARVFEPFFTTKFPGRGLGLPVVLGIVRGHGGAVFVRSERGAGTAIRVVLPRAQEPLVPGANSPKTPVRARAPVRETATVMVVEDDDPVRTVAIQFLERAGYRVLAAASGDEALRMYQRHASAIDLVLLDLAMPGLGGDVVFRRLHTINPHVTVILTSGYGEQEVLRRFHDQAPAGFLHKPYGGEQLLAKVHEVYTKTQDSPL